MHLTNPFTGEVIDTKGAPDTWVPTALDWIRSHSEMRATISELKSALAEMTPGTKKTERYVGSGYAFKVARHNPKFDSEALAYAFVLQGDMPEAMRPIRKKSVYDVLWTPYKQLLASTGDSVPELVETIKKAELPPPPPSVSLVEP